MRILHTSDWHLGHLLYQQKRDDEQRMFLEWLLEVIRSEGIDLLLVAGDIFDTGFPSNYALEMYYSFLARCGSVGCRQIVIVGGNHDSPATLRAPGEILKALRVTVIGAIDPERPEEGLVTAKDADGIPQAIICAVPYLRDRDVYMPKPAEPADQRACGIVDGTAGWYRRMTDLAIAHRRQLGVPELPIIATGHLFAQGGLKSGSEREIYVGDLGTFPAEKFPVEVAYIALGHLHRPQRVRGLDTVRYSGSPLPYSFDEAGHAKQILMFDTSTPLEIRTVPVPVFRNLVRISGDIAQIGVALRQVPVGTLTTWVEVVYTGDSLIPDLQEKVDAMSEGLPFQIVACRRESAAGERELDQPVINIQEVTPEEVFALRVRDAQLNEHDTALVREAFREILFQVRQGDEA